MEETVTKSVPVYALQNPDQKVLLHFLYPETYLQAPENAGKNWHYEEAAVIAWQYNLTGPRRPQPSIEPERTIYKSLRPWKKVPIPKYVIVLNEGDTLATGAMIVAWDGKKSLQGTAPWGRPMIGTLTGSPGVWEVDVDPIQIAILDKQEEDRRRELQAKQDAKAPVLHDENWALNVEPAPEPASPVLEPAPMPIFEGIVCEIQEPEADPTLNYTGDIFTKREDGHYVGDDGFIVPMNFDEFYERYPKYVLNWVKKRLNRFSVDDDVEDWTQDLLIHMKFLPQGSKHRTPGANGRPNGCSDVIETFNPYQQYGASERRFRNYINFCLANKFNTMQSKRQKNPVCRPGNVSFGSEQDPENEQNRGGDDFIHSSSTYLTNLADRKMKQHDDSLFTNQFKRYVKKEDPSVYPAIEALEATGPLGEAAQYMGVTEQEFARYRARLKQLGECFVQACEVPKQRKKYKKRGVPS
jgi:hypothetical protein